MTRHGDPCHWEASKSGTKEQEKSLAVLARSKVAAREGRAGNGMGLWMVDKMQLSCDEHWRWAR